jgi:hypothetical protein
MIAVCHHITLVDRLLDKTAHCLTLSEREMAVTQIQPDSTGCIRKTDLMDATRKLIRLRHYSHSTEQTYLGWRSTGIRY